nr:C2 calcium dependent membrane targeting [Hymenolepis microstoma]
MPASVKVKVFAARNLPVMDRTSFLTDAFVEVRLGNTMFKTEVIRRTLNPDWNSDWFCFELSEESLQEEFLQVRVLDHDTYSAHDTIGRVYFDLRPLLQTEQKRNLSGWFPLFDTMHGIRGEIRLAVRVDLFSDVCRHRFSSLGVRFFFSSDIPSGYVVVSLIGFVRELIMNDDPEHQWIEKIRTSRASNEARQCLFSQLAGELQRKLSRKVLNLGGNAVIGYRLHFDLEGDTGIVARAIGTAARLQRFSSSNSLQIPKSNACRSDRETGAGVTPSEESDNKSHVEAHGGKYALTPCKPLSDAEFPFLTISHPPRDLIRHFGSAIAAKSVKLLDKNVSETTKSRASWWLELRTEALTRMYNVGCDALIGYREECTIYEDVCVLSVYATAVTLNQLWIHTLSSDNSPSSSLLSRQLSGQESLGSTGTDSHAPREQVSDSSPNCLSVPLKNLSNLKHDSTPIVDCTICHIPSVNQSLPPNKSTRCRLCRGAYVPEFLLSSTDFPPELPVAGRPAFIQVGLSRSKKEAKSESAAREISELLPYIEYELHYRLLQKLRLRGMNAIFGLSLQLAIGEDLVTVLATGTGVYIPALPIPQLQKVCSISGNIGNSFVDVQQNLLSFNQECRILYGLPNVVNESGRGTLGKDFSSSNSVDLLEKENKEAIGGNSSVHLRFYEDHAGTYFIDSREPEPEELNSLLTEPLPPPGLLFMTTDNLPNEESYSSLVKLKREQNAATSNAPHGVHTFVKIHTVQSLKPDDALGSMFLHYSTSATPSTDLPSLSIPPSSTSLLESSVNAASLMNRCMAKCMRDCNQLTWFHFRCVMPCAITSLVYRLIITDDDVVQILCSGVAVTPNCEETSPLIRCTASTGSAKSEALKMAMNSTKRSIFNLPKGFRSGTSIELKSVAQQNSCFEDELAEQLTVKNPSQKIKWWKSLSKDVTGKRSKTASSAKYSKDNTSGTNSRNGFGASEEEKCVLTPSTDLPSSRVKHYLGSYSFFFVRETNDLREMGGLRCFVHTAIMEAQAVAAAHTMGLGGNALLSYQISEMLVLRPTSRNQAQCLINLCGDMVRTSVN